MADRKNVPSCSADKNNNNVSRKRKFFSAEDVLALMENDLSDSMCDELESEDSLDNCTDSEENVRAGGVDILPCARSDDNISQSENERTDLDAESESLSKSDDEFSVSASDIDRSDSSSNDENVTPPANVRRGRGRGCGRGRGRGRGRGAHRVRNDESVRGRGRGRARGRRVAATGVRNIDITSFVEPNGHQPDIPQFTAMSGMEVIPDGEKPVDFFRIYLTDDFVDQLVLETNRYATQTVEQAAIRAPLKKYSRLKTWTEVDRDTMQQFIALQLLTGLVDKPTIESYWSEMPILYTQVFPYVMSRNRYQEILRFWHVNDNSNEPARDAPNRDRLYKLRPALAHFQEKFESVYTPDKEIAIDESLLLWKGQLVFKQYIPLKRARFGIKIFSVCEASGYTYKFHIYAGKEDPSFMIEYSIPNDAKHLTMTEKVVVFMTQPLLGKGYHLYMDNWYSGHQLYLYMKKHDTVCCGTIRENRCPAPVKALELDNGCGQKSIRSGPVLYVKWKSSKIVYMVSTIHDESTKMVRRRGRNELVEKPSCVVAYNSNMGAVDRADQMLQPYSATRKTKRWYKKLLLHIIQIALLNSYILYSKTQGLKRLDFFSLQQSVIVDILFPDATNVPGSAQLPPQDDFHRLSQRHFPGKVPQTSKTHASSRKCKVCKSKGIRKETTYMCKQCPSEPPLCAYPCFEIYHTIRRYSSTE